MAGLSGAPSRGEHWIFLSGVRVPDFPLAGTRRPFRPWLTPGTGHRMRSCGDRASFEERISPYAEFEIEIEENVDLRNGMIFAVACQGRPPVRQAAAMFTLRCANLTEWAGRMIARDALH